MTTPTVHRDLLPEEKEYLEKEGICPDTIAVYQTPEGDLYFGFFPEAIAISYVEKRYRIRINGACGTWDIVRPPFMPNYSFFKK